MIERILPDDVVAVEAFGDRHATGLYAAEEHYIRRAVDKRRREFATVRWCARAALARLGIPPGALLPGPNGAPTWPNGVTGSMTHCAGYRSAAVALTERVASIGIDAEPDLPVPDDVLATIALPSELRWCRETTAGEAPTEQPVCRGRLLFTAKEAIFKAWYPLTHRWLDFTAAEVTLNGTFVRGSGGTLQGRLLVPGPSVGRQPISEFSGRWIAARGLVATAVVVASARPGVGVDAPRPRWSVLGAA
jgi:4'-phosphopantetheinyl transferase EntD